MIELESNGNTVKLKCQTDQDYREMVQNLYPNKFASLGYKSQIRVLEDLASGIFMSTVSFAKKQGWIKTSEYLHRMLSDREIKVLNIIYEKSVKIDDIESAGIPRSSINNIANILISKGLITKLKVLNGGMGRPQVMFKITDKGKDITPL